MILRAKNEGDVIIFELEGHLDFETTQQFEETCRQLIEKRNADRVVFDFAKLKFVGSSGINQFIAVLRDFNTAEQKPRLCRLSTEFDRMFRAYQKSRNPFQIFPDEKEAIASFDLPKPVTKKAPAARKKSRSN